MLIDYLNKEFQKRKKKNPRYSLSAFSQQLGVDSSTLTKLMKRTRPLTYPLFKKLCKKLNLDEATISIFLSAMEAKVQAYPTSEDYVTPNDQLTNELMAHWEFYAVLSILEIKTFKHNEKTISERLNTSPELVGRILQRLCDLGYIQKQGTGYKLMGVHLTMPIHTDRAALKRVHKEYIHKAWEVVDVETKKHHDVSGMTFCMTREKLALASEKITDFRRSLARLLSEGDEGDIVYRLNIQLFPLSKIEK